LPHIGKTKVAKRNRARTKRKKGERRDNKEPDCGPHSRHRDLRNGRFSGVAGKKKKETGETDNNNGEKGKKRKKKGRKRKHAGTNAVFHVEQKKRISCHKKKKKKKKGGQGTRFSPIKRKRGKVNCPLTGFRGGVGKKGKTNMRRQKKKRGRRKEERLDTNWRFHGKTTEIKMICKKKCPPRPRSSHKKMGREGKRKKKGGLSFHVSRCSCGLPGQAKTKNVWGKKREEKGSDAINWGGERGDPQKAFQIPPRGGGEGLLSKRKNGRPGSTAERKGKKRGKKGLQ